MSVNIYSVADLQQPDPVPCKNQDMFWEILCCLSAEMCVRMYEGSYGFVRQSLYMGLAAVAGILCARVSVGNQRSGESGIVFWFKSHVAAA
jgi:hypothetical protein